MQLFCSYISQLLNLFSCINESLPPKQEFICTSMVGTVEEQLVGNLVGQPNLVLQKMKLAKNNDDDDDLRKWYELQYNLQNGPTHYVLAPHTLDKEPMVQSNSVHNNQRKVPLVIQISIFLSIDAREETLPTTRTHQQPIYATLGGVSFGIGRRKSDTMQQWQNQNLS